MEKELKGDKNMDKEYLDWNISIDKKKRDNHENLQLRLSVRNKIKKLVTLYCLEDSTDEELIRIINDIQNELPKHPDQKLYFDTIMANYQRLGDLRKNLGDKYKSDT